jgi:hypothetical protein
MNNKVLVGGLNELSWEKIGKNSEDKRKVKKNGANGKNWWKNCTLLAR